MTPSDVKTVAENINDFIEVPDGINRLRKAVLTLAVSGKLVQQNKKEGTADELLLEVKQQREKLESGSSRKRKIQSMAPTSYKETLYDLPDSWRWSRVGEICNLQTGATPSRNNASYFGGDIPWLVSGDINRGEIFECDGRITKAGLENSNCKIIQPNSVLIALNGQGKTRATVALLRIPSALNQSLVAMTPYSDGVLPEYVFWYLRSQYREMRAITGQDDRRGLNMKLVSELAIPLPPKGEQKRIVNRVHDIFKQLNQLESQKKERDLVRSRLTRSAMQALGSADSKIAFEQLAELIKTPQDIKELENAILTLAVSGKIVSTEKNDWVVAKFDDKDLLNIIDGDRGANYPSKSEFTNEGYCLFLNTSNVRKGEFNLSRCDFITKGKDELLRKGKLVREDIVLTTRGTIGNTAYYASDIPFDNIRINSGMVILRCDTSKIFPPYLITFLNSSLFISQTNKLMSGSAQQQLPIRVLNQIFFPLPPLSEQKRIVKRVKELMTLINCLKKVIE